MHNGDTIFRWTERDFLLENDLCAYQVEVGAVSPLNDLLIGTQPATVITSLSLTDGGENVRFTLSYEHPAAREVVIAPIRKLRDALTRMLEAIEEAEAAAAPHWESKPKRRKSGKQE
jgi:hypothetical protein